MHGYSVFGLFSLLFSKNIKNLKQNFIYSRFNHCFYGKLSSTIRIALHLVSRPFAMVLSFKTGICLFFIFVCVFQHKKSPSNFPLIIKQYTLSIFTRFYCLLLFMCLMRSCCPSLSTVFLFRPYVC